MSTPTVFPPTTTNRRVLQCYGIFSSFKNVSFHNDISDITLQGNVRLAKVSVLDLSSLTFLQTAFPVPSAIALYIFQYKH